jgi:hypothetical protein
MKIQQQLKASNYMAWTSKKLVAEKGILSSPNAKPVLPPATAEMGKTILCLIKSAGSCQGQKIMFLS